MVYFPKQQRRVRGREPWQIDPVVIPCLRTDDEWCRCIGQRRTIAREGSQVEDVRSVVANGQVARERAVLVLKGEGVAAGAARLAGGGKRVVPVEEIVNTARSR